MLVSTINCANCIHNLEMFFDAFVVLLTMKNVIPITIVNKYENMLPLQLKMHDLNQYECAQHVCDCIRNGKCDSK